MVGFYWSEIGELRSYNHLLLTPIQNCLRRGIHILYHRICVISHEPYDDHPKSLACYNLILRLHHLWCCGRLEALAVDFHRNTTIVVRLY